MRKPNRQIKIYQPEQNGRRYLVSDCGRVIALEHTTSDGRLYKPNNISVIPNHNGYLLFHCNNKKVRHHRVIANLFIDNPESKTQVDHIDGDKQNNAVSNLRWVTSAQNHRAFRLKAKGKTSKFRGVCFNNDKKKWQANIQNSEKKYFLGRFDNEEEAARAYDTAAINLGFSNQALNFQPQHNHN